ncbi:MAG: hypothetical protein V3W34_09760 [Phycisphaerae bacterium]
MMAHTDPVPRFINHAIMTAGARILSRSLAGAEKGLSAQHIVVLPLKRHANVFRRHTGQKPTPGRAPASLLAGVLSAVSLAGCRAPPVERYFFPIAVWYRVDTGLAATSETAMQELADDLGRVHALGFNSVLVCPDDQVHSPLIRRAAQEQGLVTIAPDPLVQAYVAMGRFPSSSWSLEALAAYMGRSKARVFDLGTIFDEPSARRVRALAKLHHRRRAQPLTFASIRDSGRVLPEDLGVTFYAAAPFSAARPSDQTPGRVATIRVLQPLNHLDADVGEWLGAYHRALANGCTDGVVFDAFRSPAADWEGIVGSSGQVSPKRASAVKRITERARQWGLKLRGSTARPIPLDSSGPSLAVVRFSLPKRRYLMLWNQSSTRFVRKPLTVPCRFGPARRLVGVPVDERTIVGEVFMVRRGRVTLKTDLAPGDAVLYEVFNGGQ